MNIKKTRPQESKAKRLKDFIIKNTGAVEDAFMHIISHSNGRLEYQING